MKTVATYDEVTGEDGKPEPARPGLVLVFAGRSPALRILPFGRVPLVIGRDDTGGAPLDDDRVSRRHATVERLASGRILVRDLESRNGTFVDGARVAGLFETQDAGFTVLRAGGALFLLVADVRPFLGTTSMHDGEFVQGPVLARALADVATAAKETRGSVLVRGESGAGKENAARVFHAHACPEGAPFVAVNCAAIPEGVAERLLFGSKRGAYSGATDDADGFCAAADGGTLFLDEVGELPLDVQAKLLRFLETQEFFPLGASKPRRVRVRVFCATHRDLRASIAAQTFRADLYYRLSSVEVRLPPLRERREEIPWLVAHAARSAAAAHASSTTGGRASSSPPAPPPMPVHASLVETCMLRSWPGNVRELLSSVRRAVHAARGEGSVGAEHLAEDAGVGVGADAAPRPERAHAHDEQAPASRMPPASIPPPASGAPSERDRILEALRICGGNQSRAAEHLGISRRTFLRRLETLDVPRPRAKGEPRRD